MRGLRGSYWPKRGILRGRGYQFVGDVKRDGTLRAPPPPPPRALVGRDEELGRLQEALEAVVARERRTVFVTGEAGVGKTTLVEAFLAQAPDNAALLRARGFCLEHRGTGEPYMPVLEALGRLCGEHAGAPLLEALRARAPTWLIQLPWLLSSDELEEVRRTALGATPERMLRELAEALEALTTETPLALAGVRHRHQRSSRPGGRGPELCGRGPRVGRRTCRGDPPNGQPACRRC